MDIKTVLLCSSIINLFMGLFLYSIKNTQYTFKGFNYWILSALSISIAYALIALRASIPFKIAILASNNLFMLGGISRIFGLELFFKSSLSKGIVLATAVALVVFNVFICYFTYIEDSMYIRTLADAVYLTSIGLYLAWQLLKNKPKGSGLVYQITSSLFLISAFLFVVRITGWICCPEVRHFFVNSIFNVIHFVPNLVVDISWGTMFFVIHNQKLTADLKSSEEKFRSVFNNSIFGIILLDFNGKYIDVNPEYMRTTGYAREEFIDKPIGSITHPDDADEISNALRSLHSLQSTSYSGQIRILHRSGRIVWTQVNATVNYSPCGAFDYVLVELIDITQQRSAETALKQSESQLKQTNTTKDKLFSIMAHDLRSPFNSIMGFSELLIEHIGDFSKDKSLEFLQIINSQAKCTLTLLDNLLIWAKSQIEQIEFKPTSHTLSELIHELSGLLNSSARLKGVHLMYRFPTDLQIYGDKNMLLTVFRNLVTNAIKFTESGGSVSIIASQKNDHVEFSISDTGIGMNEEIRDSLFKMESSVGLNGRKNELGSGLGLIICKEFIEKHKGEIEVESIPGQGTDFNFRLPNPPLA